MSVRFFIDENDLALGKALGAIHGSVVYPGHEDLPEIPRQTLDEVWLPLIGSSGLIVITRDQRIRYRPVEKQLWGSASGSRVRAHWTTKPIDRGQPRGHRRALDPRWER